jgi:hypothetical protein
MRLNRRIAEALFTLVLTGTVVSACGSNGASPGGSSAKTTTTTAVASPTTTQAVPTLSNLTSSVQGQITGTGANGFGVTGVHNVTCTPPAVWKAGATFKCYAYDFAKDEMGEYDGTVLPESGGVPQWNGLWSPK